MYEEIRKRESKIKRKKELQERKVRLIKNMIFSEDRSEDDELKSIKRLKKSAKVLAHMIKAKREKGEAVGKSPLIQALIPKEVDLGNVTLG